MAKAKSDDEAPVPAEIAKLSFEEGLAELEDIVRRLEAGDASLEESIEIYTRGAQLKRHCETKLRAAEEKIEKIVLSPDGGVTSEPADLS